MPLIDLSTCSFSKLIDKSTIPFFSQYDNLLIEKTEALALTSVNLTRAGIEKCILGNIPAKYDYTETGNFISYINDDNQH